MVDYKKSTGSTGTMMIRDTGTYVEFWLKASSYTYNYQLPWGYTVNGNTDNSNSFRFVASGDWQRLGRWNVSTDQTVTFRLYDSGTSGLGGPTYFSRSIERSSRPDAPSAPTFSGNSGTAIFVRFDDGDNNGSPIDDRQISYGTGSGANGTVIPSDGSTSLTGLSKNTRYYVKARTHNAKGWSNWSTVRSFKTYREPSAPTAPTFSNIDQTSVKVTSTPNWDGGTEILESEIEAVIRGGTSPWTRSGLSYHFQGLQSGEVYEFRARQRNLVGWSSWSDMRSARLWAGVRINVNGVWKNAVPYVNVNGVWKAATPMAKIAGLWKETR